METVNSVREEIRNLQKSLKEGKITVSEAKEHGNLIGKMINSAKVQVEYYSLLKETPQIDFLKDDK